MAKNVLGQAIKDIAQNPNVRKKVMDVVKNPKVQKKAMEIVKDPKFQAKAKKYGNQALGIVKKKSNK